ncbi:Serine/threonine-protein phosphatase [Entamoeba marina]
MSSLLHHSDLSFLPIAVPVVLDVVDIWSSGIFDIQLIAQHLSFGGKLTASAVHFILNQAMSIMRDEKNIVETDKDCTVIGDTHGQFYDLFNLLSTVNSDCYVFLGDYVDRGEYGVELFLLLCCLKVNYPQQFILLRGNHETREITTQFTFKNECIQKYDEAIYNSFVAVFQCLPLCCVISKQTKRYFCVHGGLSPFLPTLDSINELNRFCEPEKGSALEDLLWSDPLNDDDIFDIIMGNTTVMSHLIETTTDCDLKRLSSFLNEASVEKSSGHGRMFGYNGAKTFCQTNNITTILRGHEFVEGYQCLHYLIEQDPLIVTVFSAPNYQGEGCNKGGYISIEEDNFSTKKFNATCQQYVIHEHVLNFGSTSLFEKICV